MDLSKDPKIKRRTFWWLRESWIRGCPDGRTIPSAGFLDYEDTILKKKLPKDNELPDSTYATKVVCPLGLEVQKIHACPNDCILYRGAYEDLNACSVRESWIRGCPDGRTILSAGLLDYEDTRLKTSSRVRKGLSLAWKASLAIRI